MRFATVLLLIGLLGLFVRPEAADAGRPKSPYWASVSPVGNLIRGNGVASVARVEEGVYDVRFGTEKGSIDITECAYSATLYAPSLGHITVLTPGDPDWIRVFTYDSSGSGVAADSWFHLIVHCRR